MINSKPVHFLLVFWITISTVFSQDFTIEKLEPPNWWSGMKWNNLQLMIYGSNLDGIDVAPEDSRLVISKVFIPESNTYAFVDISIPDNLPGGNYSLIFSKEGEIKSVEYSILERKKDPNSHRGFDINDVIYLIFPDRFVNGDSTNDYWTGAKEEFDFFDLNGRHGGDIAGIINKLDYLKDLGVSALWICPMLENNMYMSYHGYASTDLYKIDPRFGTNELYKTLVEKAHANGIKIILDHVSNHIGINHRWAQNIPMTDWFNGSAENHISTNHDKVVLIDNYSDSTSIELMTNGWFTSYMPDLNQTNIFLGNYIIQNTIWWLEYAGIDGIREDTYPYCDQEFMARWAKEVLNEYPDLNIVGEVWKGEAAFLAKFQKNSLFPRKFDTNLPAITDFNMSDAYKRFLSGEKGLNEIYENLAKDFVYSDPQNLVVFLDNHDVDRALYTAKGDYDKLKMALFLLFTTRGIPQIFYGTEIGINGGGHHGRIRTPFPGGFPEDSRNAFTEGGREENENDLFYFIKKLISLRKSNPPLSNGKFIHIYPANETYVYFKIGSADRYLMAVNNNSFEVQIDFTKYNKILSGVKSFDNLFTNELEKLEFSSPVTVPAKGTLLFKANN